MCLALESTEENNSSTSSSLSTHSTPASDTFYTATSSILSPDPNEITSPFPIDEVNPWTDRMNSTPENINNLLGTAMLGDLLTSPIYPIIQHQYLKNTDGLPTTSTPIKNNLPEGVSSESSTGPSTDEELCASLPSKSLCNSSTTENLSNSLDKFSEKSELLSFGNDVSDALDVAQKLESKATDQSLQEQQKEFDQLKEMYTDLEQEIIKEEEKKDNLDKRQTQLPELSELKFLNEGRVALLIEREVNRRVLERFNSLESEFDLEKMRRRGTDASLTSLPNGMIGSFSPESIHRNFTRPHSSMSARNYDLVNGGDIRTDISPSENSEYSMPCGYCITIPGYQQRGTGSLAHWEYEIRLAAGKDSWSIFRRYRRFRELHMFMRCKYGIAVQELYFPPRRIFGNNSRRVARERSVQLQIYMQQLLVLCSDMEGSPLCDVEPSRKLLTSFSSFFDESLLETARFATTS